MEGKAEAWIFERPGRPLVKRTIDLPVLKESEILVENLCCTPCKSDLHTFTGKRPGPVPSVLGHEIIGRVAELPKNEVYDFEGNVLRLGDLITWSLIASCYQCRICRNGFPQKCLNLKKYGHEKMEGHFQLSGGFATHTHLYPGTSVFKLPEDINPGILTGLNCSWSTVAAALRLAGNVKNRNVLITGGGMLGILTAAMCKEKGAEKIIIVEPKSSRLALAYEFGAELGTIWDEKNPKFVIGQIKRHLGKEMVDVFFEMSGSNQAVSLGLDVSGIGAVMVLAGSVFPVDNVEFNPENIVRKLIQIKGSHNYIPKDLQQSILFLQGNHLKYPFKKLFDEKEFSFETINEAIKHALISPAHRIVINIRGIETDS